MTAKVQSVQLFAAAAVVACVTAVLASDQLTAAYGYPAAILLGLLTAHHEPGQSRWSRLDLALVVGFTALVALSYWLGGLSPSLASALAATAALGGVGGVLPSRMGWARSRWPDEIPDWIVAPMAAASVTMVGGLATGIGVAGLQGARELGWFAVGLACAAFPAALIVMAWTAVNPKSAKLQPDRPLMERLAVGAGLSLLSLLVFVTDGSLFLPTLLAAAVAWVAVRLSYVDVLLSISSVSVVSSLASLTGRGPFPSSVAAATTDRPLASVDLLLLHEFVTVTTLIAIFVSLSVQGRRRSQRRADRERSNLVDLARAARSVAIAELDTTGQLLMLNAGGEQLFGMASQTASGLAITEFLDPVEIMDRARSVGVEPAPGEPADTTFVRLCEALCAPGPHQEQTGHWDWTIHALDGAIRVATFNVSAVRDELGHPMSYLCAAIDVTGRASAEASLSRALAAERDAEARLRAVDQAKDTFVSTVSHELRTPITNILGYAELLEAGDLGSLTPSQAQALARMVSNSERLLGLVTDLLTLTQVQSEEIQLHRRSLSVHALVRRAESAVAASLRDRQQTMHVVLPPKALMVFADPDRLHQVLVALLSNAIKFTAPGGRIGISALQLEHQVMLSISDTGVGFPAEEDADVFRSFYRRAEVVHAHTQGTGLGLSVARSIVELHGGTLHAVSTPGQGSVFTVALPLANSDEAGPRLVVDAPHPRRSA